MYFPQKQTKSSFHCFKYIEFLKLAVIICAIGLFDRLDDILNLIFHFSNSFYFFVVTIVVTTFESIIYVFCCNVKCYNKNF